MKHATALLFGIVPTMAMAVLQAGGTITNHPSCGLANGSIWAYGTGGTPPYSFVWSPVPAIGQGTQNVSGLDPGVWTVTVTDALAAEATANFTLVDRPLGDVTFTAITYGYNQSGAHHPCIGTSDGSFSVILSQLGGTPPYTITANGMPPIGYDLFTNDPYFGYFSLNDGISVSITDANGCMGGANVGMDGPSTAPFSADNINPACGGLNNGSVDLSFGFSGPYGPYLSITGPSGNVYGETPFGEPLTLTGLEPGSYFLARTYNPIYFASPCQFVEQFTIPDLGPDCGSVSGRLFIDNNQNCAQNSGEPSVPYRVIEINPGPEYAITSSSGDYTRNLVNGSYTLEAQGTGTDLYPICPPVQPAPFTINYNNVTLDLADSSLIPLDLRVVAGNNVARPGFAHTIWGNVRNLSAQISGAVTLTVTYDPQMSYVGANPTPTSMVSNTLTWDLPAFLAYGDQNFSVQLQVPANAGLIGSPYAHAISCTQPITESTYVNNSVGLSGVFQGSYDPNDKQVLTSTHEQESIYVIGEDEWLDYTIRFQNTGTDTAFTVVVTDTISAALDLSTYEQGVASHPFDVSFKSGRVVEWRFANIHLPDSNVNEAASHGLVSFRIRPHLPLLPGTVLANNADIFFDFNDPVRTNDATVTAEMTTFMVRASSSEQQLKLAPNPAEDQLFVSLQEGSIEQLRILAMDGREVRSRLVRGPSTRLEVSDLRAGAYLVEVTMRDGTRSGGPGRNSEPCEATIPSRSVIGVLPRHNHGTHPNSGSHQPHPHQHVAFCGAGDRLLHAGNGFLRPTCWPPSFGGMKVLAVIGVTVFVVSGFRASDFVPLRWGTPKTVLWRITSDPSLRASYLLGTVHSRDDRAFQWGDSLVPAMHSVDLVAGELDLEQDQRKILSVMPMAMMPGGRTLQSLYRKREWKEVNAALQEKLGYMVGMVSRVKPFFVILMISGSEVDGPHEHVLDETIMRMAGSEGKEVIGLETMQEQMAALDVLPLDRQARLLLEFVRTGDEGSEMDAMLDAYAAQDLDELMRVMEASPTMPTEMDASLIVERNKRMAHRMDSIMVDGTCGFFAVGAGHLPRVTGIIALLRARGYRVEPVYSSYTKPKEPKLPPEDDKDR